jgi:hypothetical protein
LREILGEEEEDIRNRAMTRKRRRTGRLGEICTSYGEFG